MSTYNPSCCPSGEICARLVTHIQVDRPLESRQTEVIQRMPFRVAARHLGEVLVIVPQVYEDDRGYFMETFRADLFASLGLPRDFPQDNHSRSVRGGVRGLHFLWDPPMGKRMRVTYGS